MLRLISFRFHAVQVARCFQAFPWNLQWLAGGVVSGLLVTGFSIYKTSLNHQSQEATPTIGTLSQANATQHPRDCGADEVFRVSDRRCYQLQGE